MGNRRKLSVGRGRESDYDYDRTRGTADVGRKSGWTGVLAFLALAFAFSWSVEIGLRPLGVPYALRAILAMYGPALAAFLVRGPLLREGFADAGLHGWFARTTRPWYLVALAGVPACLALGAALALTLHLQRVDPLANALALMARVGQAPTPADIARMLSPVTLVAGGIAACTIAPFVNALFAFGEEFGWRGYLLPRLTQLIGVAPAIVAVGVVWGLWHAPLIVLDGLNYPTHRWAGIGMMVVYCIALSAFFAALRLRSGSVLPSTLAHGALNAEAGLVAVLLAPADGFANAPIGLAGALPFAMAGIALLARRRRPANGEL